MEKYYRIIYHWKENPKIKYKSVLYGENIHDVVEYYIKSWESCGIIKDGENLYAAKNNLNYNDFVLDKIYVDWFYFIRIKNKVISLFCNYIDDIIGVIKNIRDIRVEYDNAKNIIGYKYIIIKNEKIYSIHHDEEWENLGIEADKVPQIKNTNGIYAAKNSKSHILFPYSFPTFNGEGIQKASLVRILLSGKVIESTFGYRAEHADIIEILS
jgi:hypothetical protein